MFGIKTSKKWASMFKIRQTGYSILYAMSCSFIVEVIHLMEQVN